MKRILVAGMFAATIFAVSCGTNEDRKGHSDSVLNSPPPAGATPDNTTTPGTLADSTSRDSMRIDSTASMQR